MDTVSTFLVEHDLGDGLKTHLLTETVVNALTDLVAKHWYNFPEGDVGAFTQQEKWPYIKAYLTSVLKYYGGDITLQQILKFELSSAKTLKRWEQESAGTRQQVAKLVVFIDEHPEVLW